MENIILIQHTGKIQYLYNTQEKDNNYTTHWRKTIIIQHTGKRQ